MIPWRLIGAGAAVLAVVGALLWIRHDAYRDGQAEREAYYSPIIADIQRQADAAKARVQELERAASAINDMISNEDKQRAEDAIRQRDAARADRVRLAAALARCRTVPTVPGGTSVVAPAPGDDERFRAADEALGDLAYRCQRDADRLRAFQDWYRAIAASQLAP